VFWGAVRTAMSKKYGLTPARAAGGVRFAKWRDGFGERQKERFGLDVWSSNPAAMADIRRRMRNARKQERALTGAQG
jgi:hypothetical protein